MCSRGRCGHLTFSCTAQCTQCFLCVSLFCLVFSGKPAAFFSPYRSLLFSHCACVEWKWSVLSWLHERWSDLRFFSPPFPRFPPPVDFNSLSFSVWTSHYSGFALSSCPCWAMQPPPRKVRKCPSLHNEVRSCSWSDCLFICLSFLCVRARSWCFRSLHISDFIWS